MPEYKRKKPDLVNAQQWMPVDNEGVQDMEQFLGAPIKLKEDDPNIMALTVEGESWNIAPGAYIIKPAIGEPYPVDAEAFENIYEEAN